MTKSKLSAAIGRRVRLLRERDRMSRAKLADKIEMAPYTLTKIELGISDPKISTMDRIARALHVPIAELLDDVPLEDRGRQHRRVVNDLMRTVLAQDADTVSMLSDMIETALALKRPRRR